jgi:hypothetical protein
MQFPIFQVPHVGNGMTIALDAVLHEQRGRQDGRAVKDGNQAEREI